MGPRRRISLAGAVVLMSVEVVEPARAGAPTDDRSWVVGAPTWGLFAPDHPYDWVWGLVTVCLFVVLLIKLITRR